MFLNSLDISGSGMTAQRLCMDVISQNISNQDTTRTQNGQPYRRKVTVLREKTQTSFDAVLGNVQTPGGVEVAAVQEDPSAFKIEHDPSSPDADANGNVQLPNVDLTTEMVGLMNCSRSYEADVTSFNAVKGMAQTALQIGK